MLFVKRISYLIIYSHLHCTLTHQRKYLDMYPNIETLNQIFKKNLQNIRWDLKKIVTIMENSVFLKLCNNQGTGTYSAII